MHCSSLELCFRSNWCIRQTSLYPFSFSGPFPCEICGRQFNDTGNRKRHIECTHGGKRKWTCFVCGKSVRERYISLSLNFPHIFHNSYFDMLNYKNWCLTLRCFIESDFLLKGQHWGSTWGSTVVRNLTSVVSVAKVSVTAAPTGGSGDIWRISLVLVIDGVINRVA